MSFLKDLWARVSGGSSASGSEPAEEPSAAAAETEYKGFLIRALPVATGREFQPAGVILKEIDGETKEHRFIRVDRFTEHEAVVAFSLAKGRQIIDEQGERMFG